MRRLCITACVAIAAAGVVPAACAQSSEDKQRERAESTIREGAETILRGIEQLLRSIPQYDAPEVMENGDIVIRRRPPKDVPSKPAPPPGNGESRT